MADQSSPSFCCMSNDEINTTELQFDMIRLMRKDEDVKRQAQKTESLTTVIRACSHASVQQGGDGHTEGGMGAVLPKQLASLRRFLCTSPNAKDHRGCFRVFTKTCTPLSPAASSARASLLVSMPSNVLFSQESPLVYLRDSLSYQSEATIQKRGGMMYDASEAVVWCSSTLNNEEEEFASKVLDDMPFAQLYLGSGSGKRKFQGDDNDCDNHLVVELDLKTVQVLESTGVLICSGNKRDHTPTVCCKLKLDDVAVIDMVLASNKQHESEPLHDQNQQQSTIIKLIDVAVEAVQNDPLNKKKEPHLVLLTHSITASVVAAAISSWKLTANKQLSTRRVEDLLNQAVTVVTFGNMCQSFCDGPAYIHISMHDDPWTTTLGSHSNNHAHGGRGAVYFHACSPYEHDQVLWEEAAHLQQKKSTAASSSSLTSHNAHNLSACIIQYLYLIMRINGIQSFRALYDAARFEDPTFVLDINPKHFAVRPCNHGDLVVPPHIDDELLPAMIRATGGDGWIWRKTVIVDGVDHEDDEIESLLPDEIETRSHLEESFGYNVLEEIHATCCRS